jgi:Domain of unknown function (DUF6285)
VSHDRPTPEELVEAVREFLEQEVLLGLDDRRLRFRTLVAMNALGIAARELSAKEAGPTEAELRALARRIRAGEVPEGTLALLKEQVAARLRIASPRYLERYS